MKNTNTINHDIRLQLKKLHYEFLKTEIGKEYVLEKIIAKK